jgi:hypothetical protein
MMVTTTPALTEPSGHTHMHTHRMSTPHPPPRADGYDYGSRRGNPNPPPAHNLNRVLVVRAHLQRESREVIGFGLKVRGTGRSRAGVGLREKG